MPFPGLWGRFDRIMIVRKQRFSMSKFTEKYCPDCKVLFLCGELFVVNGSCAEMKADHLRKFRKSGVSIDGLKWHFQSFLSQGRTRKRQNKSLVHQKYADFVGFS